MKDSRAILIPEDGTMFAGKHAGASGTTTGEICFNTGMTGYQEVFTDPSYYGQVMVTTNAFIGNYGVKKSENQSKKIQISGLVAKNFTSKYSRPIGDNDLDSFFQENNIVVIYDVDTRAIVKHIRDKGAMNCIISSKTDDMDSLQAKLKATPSMAGLELASNVSTNKIYECGDSSSDIKIAVMDYGVKQNILDCMTNRGAYLKVFPAKSSFAEVSEMNPDGYFLSNGPGDPSTMDYAVENIKQMLETGKPIFGICLGHQLLSLANGLTTYKMHNGHRGINHPVINLTTGKCEITSQNHGFGVDPKSVELLENKITVTHRNLNDDTIEGIKVKDKHAFSVQYHPEAAPGPHDSRYLFDEFIQLIKTTK